MRYLLLLIALVFPGTVFNALALSMEEAVALTLANNQRIVQFQADKEEVTAGIGSAEAEFYPSFDLDYAYSNRQDPAIREEDEASIFSLSASYNLFNGLADLNTFKAAKARSKAAGYLLRAEIADLVLKTRQAYIEHLRALHSVDTSREGVELLERQLRDNKLFFQQGLIARNDLLRVEVAISTARQTLLLTEGELQITKRRLERLTGVPLAEGQTLEDFSQQPQLPKFNAEYYRQQMLTSRSELQYLELLVKAAGYERAAAKGDNLPELDLVLAHEEYGDSLSPTSGDFSDDSKLLLTARWNLFNGFATRQAVVAADARKRSLSAEFQDTKDALFLQLQTALIDIQVAQGRQQEALVGVTQAVENYRITENLHRQQRATTFDLVDARFLLTRARFQEISARYTLHDKMAVLDRVLERDTFH